MYVSIYTGILCGLAAPAMAMVWENLATGPPSGWRPINNKPSYDSTVTLSIALSRQNLDHLEPTLARLSTPGSSEYGQWLGKDDIDSLFPIVDDSSVVSWLHKAGISKITREGGLLNFTSSIDKANQLLNTSFAYYQNEGSIKLRTTEYSIPDDLEAYIDVISPTVYFGTPSAAPQTSESSQLQAHRDSPQEVSASCQTIITPQCLKEMYNVGDYIPQPAAGSRVGFGSFLNQSAQKSDLEAYEALFDLPTQSFTVELLNGGIDDQNASDSDVGEANLDVQLIAAISHPLPIHEFITGGLAYERTPYKLLTPMLILLGLLFRMPMSPPKPMIKMSHT